MKKLANGSLQNQYTLTDHLGNTRVMFADTNNNGSPEIVEESHYYAFGMRIEGLSTTNPDNKFTYNGKELEDDHGLNWYHYGARFYDAQIGRWHVVDLVDEFHSSYLFVANNPIRNRDPNGLWNDDVVRIARSLVDPNKKYGDAKKWNTDQTTWHESPQLVCNQFIYTAFRLAGILPSADFEPSRADIGNYFRRNYSVFYESQIDWNNLEPADVLHYGSYQGNYGGHILMIASTAIKNAQGEISYIILHAKSEAEGIIEEEVTVSELQRRMATKGNENVYLARGPGQMDVTAIPSDPSSIARRDISLPIIPINVSSEEIE
jgi:RHS repeat-associated protein